MADRPLVSIVDDDQSVCESLPDLLKVCGFEARAFSSAEEFLASDCIGKSRGLILDVALSGMSGPELQEELRRRGLRIPILFITAQADASLRQRVIAKGAVECLFKPFSDTALLDALKVAIQIP
jgi:FixJ family two-component response regulator